MLRVYCGILDCDGIKDRNNASLKIIIINRGWHSGFDLGCHFFVYILQGLNYYRMIMPQNLFEIIMNYNRI